MDQIICARNLHKIFRMGSARVHALSGVTFAVERSQITAIIGTSGCGKSTLLNILAGLEAPTKGEIIVDGTHIENLGEEQLIDYRKKKIGFIFQSFNLFQNMTAAENVALPLMLQGYDRRKCLGAANKLLRIFGLVSHAAHLPSRMSGGQQQRICIARALITKPRILFADEPTGNLDTQNSDDVMQIFKQIAEQTGTTVVIVTHDREIARMSHTVLEMRDGRIVNEGVLA